MAIPVIASKYGGNNDIGKESGITHECVRIVLSSYQHLSVFEIMEMYRMWGTGQFQVKENAEIWGGRFTALQFARVISAYARARVSLHGAITLLIDREGYAARENERKQKQKQQFEEKFNAHFEFAKNNVYSFKKIPAWWFYSLEKTGELNLTKDEKWRIYRLAQRVVQMEINRARRVAVGFRDRIRIAEREEKIEATAKNYACKMATYIHVIRKHRKTQLNDDD